jgi:hypothetical protein
VNFTLLGVAFHRQVRPLFTRDLVGPLLKIIAASAVMAPVIWVVSSRLELIHGAGTTIFAFKVLPPIVIGAIVYFAAARVFGVDEAKVLVARFRR